MKPTYKFFCPVRSQDGVEPLESVICSGGFRRLTERDAAVPPYQTPIQTVAGACKEVRVTSEIGYAEKRDVA
jgi:hypothetical protein